MIVIFVVVLVVFGPQKLPELARGLGKLMAEFRKASADFRGAFEQEMRDIERQAMQAERKKQAEAAAKAAAEVEQPVTQGSAEGAQAPGTEGSGGARLTEGAAGLEPVVAPVPEAIARSSEGGEEPGASVNANGNVESASEDRESSAANDGGNSRSEAPVTDSAATDAESLSHDIHRPA